MVELQLARSKREGWTLVWDLLCFPPVSFQTGKVSSNSKVFCCVLAPEKTPQGALSVLSNKVGTKVMSWGDTQEGTLIVLHPRGDWEEIQTSLTTLFSHGQGTSEGILSNFNVDQRRVGRWKSSLDGHQPSRVAQVPPVAPCLECSTSNASDAARLVRAGRTTVRRDDSIDSATGAWHKLSVRSPEQLVPPRNIQIGRQLPSTEVAAESDPLRSPSSNDKTIYACYLCLDLWDVGAFISAPPFCMRERWFVTTVCLLATGDSVIWWENMCEKSPGRLPPINWKWDAKSLWDQRDTPPAPHRGPESFPSPL